MSTLEEDPSSFDAEFEKLWVQVGLSSIPTPAESPIESWDLDSTDILPVVSDASLESNYTLSDPMDSLAERLKIFKEQVQMPEKASVIKDDRLEWVNLVDRDLSGRYDCPSNECIKSFSHKNSLKFHFATVHLGIYPYDCPLCQKRFPRPDRLKNHLKSVHSKQ